MELIELSSNILISRLVVLVDNFRSVDELGLGGKIRALAHPKRAAVLYLTVVDRLEDDMPALHRLTRLAAVTRDAWVRADMQVAVEQSWTSVIRRLYQPGDLMVCFEGHQVPAGFFGHKSMVSELSNHLNLPVWVLKNGRPHSG